MLVSDRNTHFTSALWTGLHAALGASLVYGSPHHHTTARAQTHAQPAPKTARRSGEDSEGRGGDGIRVGRGGSAGRVRANGPAARRVGPIAQAPLTGAASRRRRPPAQR